MTVAWIFLLLVIVAGSTSCAFQKRPHNGLAQAGEIATDEKPAYAQQGASLVTY
jgi:hypothetical protein